MTLRRFLTRIAARHLSSIGKDQHRRIIAKAQQMRRECGLPDDPRLAR